MEAVSGIMLTMLLLGMVTLAFTVQPVKSDWTWAETIYIRADGSIDPDTAPISTFDNITYTLTDNIVADVQMGFSAIVVERDDIVIDGAGYAVEGTGIYYSRGIDLTWRSNVTIKNMSIRAFFTCIVLDSSSGNRISGNDITASCVVNGGYGMTLYSSSGNNISGNKITANKGWGGITLGSSSSNSICRNNVTDCGTGIELDSSNNNSIIGNDLTANNEDGLFLSHSSNNNISGNKVTATNNWYGHGIWLSYSSGNSISENNITANNMYGVYLSDSSGNKLYHNNFINNTNQVRSQDSVDNVWDDGYPSGGNYWSNYISVDEKSGLNQDQLGSDGIGDTPHIIDANNRDRYPLMNLWPPPEHELSASIATPAWTKRGSPSFLNATVKNLGLNDEADVGLVILINGTIEDSTMVPLVRAASSHTLTYQWTPTASGTYNVTAHVPPLPEEENTQNNQVTEFVTVYNSLPPVASFTYSPTVPIVGGIVTFDASASYDPDGSIISYDWKFGDGAVGSEKIMTHAYADAGSYTVSLTVKDNTMDTSTFTSTILTAPTAGVKAGDWIKIDYTVSGAPSGSPLPQWLKMEVLTVEGTVVTLRVTMHMSDGTEQSETLTVDVVAGGQALGLSGFLIPASCTTGNCIYMTGYGNVTIEGETTRTYAGASRTVVYASISQYGIQLTYYWDKQTGVMVEASTTSGSITATGKATETNMWQADSSPFWMQWWFYTIVAVAIVALVGAIYFLKKRKPPTPTVTPALPTEGT